MSITLKTIPGGEDKDKDVLVDGVRVGCVYRGWLRSGGNQWVAQLTNGASSFGASTLRDLKRDIAAKV